MCHAKKPPARDGCNCSSERGDAAVLSRGRESRARCDDVRPGSGFRPIVTALSTLSQLHGPGWRCTGRAVRRHLARWMPQSLASCTGIGITETIICHDVMWQAFCSTPEVFPPCQKYQSGHGSKPVDQVCLYSLLHPTCFLNVV